MKHTDRWLLISIVVVGLTIVLLGVKFFLNYRKQVSQVNSSSTRTEATASENTSEPSSDITIPETPYSKISTHLGHIEVMPMTEEIYCGGYRLELTNCYLTQEYDENWLVATELLERRLEGQIDENYNILSDARYVVLHIKMTAYEEYFPYVEEGIINEVYLTNSSLWLYNSEQEYLTGYEPTGITYSDSYDAKSMFRVELNYGETKEFDLVFIEEEGILVAEENPILVYEFNVSGVNIPDLRKGVVLDVAD